MSADATAISISKTSLNTRLRVPPILQELPRFGLAVAGYLYPDPLMEKWIHVLDQHGNLAQDVVRNSRILQQPLHQRKLDAIVGLHHNNKTEIGPFSRILGRSPG